MQRLQSFFYLSNYFFLLRVVVFFCILRHNHAQRSDEFGVIKIEIKLPELFLTFLRLCFNGSGPTDWRNYFSTTIKKRLDEFQNLDTEVFADR